MTSSWKPPSVKPDGHGNVRLTAYDGTQMVVQRRDVDDLIRALEAERDRHLSTSNAGDPPEET